jgi:hypothetical protein
LALGILGASLVAFAIFVMLIIFTIFTIFTILACNALLASASVEEVTAYLIRQEAVSPKTNFFIRQFCSF